MGRLNPKTKPCTPFEVLSLANKKSQKLGVLDEELEGSHSPLWYYLDKC